MCDEECMKRGTEWSVAFKFNGVTLILLAITYLGFAIGSHFWIFRIVAACANCWVSIIHFAAVIVTCVHRFSKKGSLAAICLDGSVFEAWDKPISASWTFKKDS